MLFILHPSIVMDYNSNMNCVDKFDKKKKVYEIDRKSHKWWHRIFFYFLDAAVINAHVIYSHISNKSISLKNFRREISQGLVATKILQLTSKRSSFTNEMPVTKKKKRGT